MMRYIDDKYCRLRTDYALFCVKKYVLDADGKSISHFSITSSLKATNVQGKRVKVVVVRFFSARVTYFFTHCSYALTNARFFITEIRDVLK